MYQTAKDQKESFRWAKLAADQGYAQAERFVGACYEYGIGVPANPAEAALWYNRAAAQGLANIPCRNALMLVSGHKRGRIFA